VSAPRLYRVATAIPLCLAAGTLGCRPAIPPVEPSFVAEWMHDHYGLIRSERLSPPVAARVTAYAAVALYEGLATGSKTLRSIAGQLNGLDSLPRPPAGAELDPELVALEAQSTVLDTIYREGLPQTKAALAAVTDSLRQARLAPGVSAAIGRESATYGHRLGFAILDWARRDGFDTTRSLKWAAATGKQYWVNTSDESQYVAQNLSAARDYVAIDNPAAALRPGSASERALIVNRPKSSSISTVRAVNPVGATEPYWGVLRPFVLKTADECPSAPPYPYSEDHESAFYRDAMVVFDESHKLDDARHKTVLFWADNPGQSGTPTGHWLSIAGQMVAQLHLDADRAAELYLLASLAQADAFIATWKVKYETMVVRPVTYINRLIDPKWRTDIITPSFPEYPSGHSVQSAAAAAVMTGLLGDHVAFDDSTGLALGHPVRRFDSFWAAATEAAKSRLYGGIHYPAAVFKGQDFGRCIGQKALERVRTKR
jgi:membrane-associated phospholipid phosphatase